MLFGLTPYHCAVVVPDLDAHVASFGDAFGVDLADPVQALCHLRTRDGTRFDHTIRSAWSRGSAPWLELTQAAPGTIWQPGDGFHHVGFWASDLEQLTARCVSGGAQIELEGALGPEQPWSFRYLRLPGGLRVELVDESMRPGMELMCRPVTGS